MTINAATIRGVAPSARDKAKVGFEKTTKYRPGYSVGMSARRRSARPLMASIRYSLRLQPCEDLL